MNTSPLGIPEILSLICQVLERNDQVACMRVSRSFHDGFAPYVWKSMNAYFVRSQEHFLSGLRRNAYHIRTLRLHKREEVATVHQCTSQDRSSFSQLESLNLDGIPVSDEVLAEVLRHMLRLKNLDANGTGFGPLSFQALVGTRQTEQTGEASKGSVEAGRGRPCGSIEELDLMNCSDVTSAMVQTILENCPKLLRLSAERIDISDIDDGEDWVCTQLQAFNVHISADIYGHYGVFLQLSRLTKLQTLHIGDEFNEDGQNPTLDLEVTSGLDKLGGLKDLTTVTFSCEGASSVGLADVHWMADNWPALKIICGDIIPLDDGVAEEMEEILRAKGIQAHFIENGYECRRRGP
ncbi:hypothetical protein BGZ47_002713 [Haplosporangium gracile]|nr:hypothetical protein BGZ47_002713 [Haplosporangium gracile]